MHRRRPSAAAAANITNVADPVAAAISPTTPTTPPLTPWLRLPSQTTASPPNPYTSLEKPYSSQSIRGPRRGGTPLVLSGLQKRRTAIARLSTPAIDPGGLLLPQRPLKEEQQLERRIACSQSLQRSQLTAAGLSSIVINASPSTTMSQAKTRQPTQSTGNSLEALHNLQPF